MVFSFSVYDLGVLEKKLRLEQDIDLSEECRYNSEVIYQILQYADRVLPEFSSLSDDEVRKMADSVAYMMRTDIIIQQQIPFGLIPLPEEIKPSVYDINNVYVHLRNDPDILSPEWELPYYDRDPLQVEDFKKTHNVATEFLRCYSAIITWSGLSDKLNPVVCSFDPAFKLAQVTAFLLTLGDLANYQYTPEDIERFNNTLNNGIIDS
ncbi:hypothetical protein GQ472_01425 [archaeon]|nr:hypothetical protein [archaeon]